MIKYKLMSLKKKKKSELIFFGRTCFEVTISDTSQLQEVGGLLFFCFSGGTQVLQPLIISKTCLV